MTDGRIAPHLPYPVPIDGYGRGGFRFAGMSHRGSLLCLPSGIWAWPPNRAEDIAPESLAVLIAEAQAIDMLLIGSGAGGWTMPAPLHRLLREHGIASEVMRTGTAVTTYNLLLGERRRVAAALIAMA